jgi:hypothetical protein
MKVIFLDFNGILDTFENMDVIDPDNLNRLKRIVDESGAKVVLTTSNKNIFYYSGQIRGILKYIIDSLLEVGIDIVGMVPMLDNREDEIREYLNGHKDIESFVILDDDYDMPSFKDNLIKLPSQMIGIEQRGLEDKHVDIALNILGKKLSIDTKKRLF